MSENSVGQLLCALTRRFKKAGVESAKLDARVLLAHAIGAKPLDVFNHPEWLLSDAQMASIETLARRREAREPVSRIIGEREFWSLPFMVHPSTLDPRPDSETIIQAVLDHIEDKNAPVTVLDLGTGTGCLVLALLSELPNAWGIGVDKSEQALTIARLNADRLGLADRASFLVGDWGGALDLRADVILSNPPYIPYEDIKTLEPEVALFDPLSALSGGMDGLSCYRSLLSGAERLLSENGFLIVEIGEDQGESVSALFRTYGFANPVCLSDLAGRPRAVAVSLHKTKEGTDKKDVGKMRLTD